MPVTVKNENEDLLGNLLKQPAEESRGYNPRQWQDAAYGQSKNRVLAHGSGGDVAELLEPQPAIPRMVSIPEKDAEAIPVLNKFFEDNSDLKPHAQTIIREVQGNSKERPRLSSVGHIQPRDFESLQSYRPATRARSAVARPAESSDTQ